MQKLAADHGCNHRGSPELLGGGVELSRVFRSFAVSWVLLAGLLILAPAHDSQAASKKRPSHRHRASSPQIIPQKPRSGVQAGEAESLYYAGVALHAKGNYAEAVEKFKAALQKRTEFPEARHAMGLSLAAQGALDEAIHEYRAALSVQPEFAAIHNNLGVALSEKGKVDEAIEAYRYAIRLQPGNAAPHHNLALALEAKDDVDGAVEEYRETLRL